MKMAEGKEWVIGQYHAYGSEWSLIAVHSDDPNGDVVRLYSGKKMVWTRSIGSYVCSVIPWLENGWECNGFIIVTESAGRGFGLHILGMRNDKPALLLDTAGFGPPAFPEIVNDGGRMTIIVPDMDDYSREHRKAVVYH